MRKVAWAALALVLALTEVAGADAKWSFAYGLEALPTTGPTNWSLTLVDEYGYVYSFAISQPSASGWAHRIDATYQLVRTEATDQAPGGDLRIVGSLLWGKPAWEVAGGRIGLWGGGIEGPVLFRGGLSYTLVDVRIGQDYVRPAYPGDPGMFLSGPHGESYIVERGTPVRLEARQTFWSADAQVAYVLGQSIELQLTGGWRFGVSGEVQTLAEYISYPAKDVRLPDGTGTIGAPDWGGPYWSVGLAVKF